MDRECSFLGFAPQAAKCARLKPLWKGFEALFLEFGGRIQMLTSSVGVFIFSGMEQAKLPHTQVNLPQKSTFGSEKANCNPDTVLQQITEHQGLWRSSISPERSPCAVFSLSFKTLSAFEDSWQKPASAQPPYLHRFPLQTVEGNRLLLKVMGVPK